MWNVVQDGDVEALWAKLGSLRPEDIEAIERCAEDGLPWVPETITLFEFADPGRFSPVAQRHNAGVWPRWLRHCTRPVFVGRRGDPFDGDPICLERPHFRVGNEDDWEIVATEDPREAWYVGRDAFAALRKSPLMRVERYVEHCRVSNGVLTHLGYRLPRYDRVFTGFVNEPWAE